MRLWVAEEINKLIEMYNSEDPYHSYKKIADILNRTIVSCSHKINRLRKKGFEIISANKRVSISNVISQKERFKNKENHPLYNKGHSKETKEKLRRYALNRPKEHNEKISRSIKELLKNKENHPSYGKKLSKEAKKNLRDKALERFKNKEHHPWYGRSHSNESKRKMSETRKKIYSFPGYRSPMYGRRLSKETKKKIGDTKRGSQNWNWKGGVSLEKYKYYNHEFEKNQKIIKKTYKNCLICKIDERKSLDFYNNNLHVAHINPIRPDIDYVDNSLSNLILLCPKCHTLYDNRQAGGSWVNLITGGQIH